MRIKQKYIGFIFVSIMLFLTTGVFGHFERPDDGIDKTTFKVPMADNVRLVTDVYSPEGKERRPVILIRTPYGGKQWGALIEHFCGNDYIVVVQNTRGTGGSEGKFVWFTYERTDGLTTLDWIVKQPWSNGKVGLFGISYLAYTGLILTPENHHAFITMVNVSGMADMHSFIFPGGASRFMESVFRRTREKPSSMDGWGKIFRTIPAKNIFGGRLAGPNQFQGIDKEYEKIELPILHVSGWFDYIYPNTLTVYQNIREYGKSSQSLIMGPWWHNHVFSGESIAGDEDFGPAARREFSELWDISARWFDYWIKGIDNGIGEEDPIQLFIMGKNRWESFPDFPLPSSDMQKWYISSKKGANSSEGDGRLSPFKPKKGGCDTFSFDPSYPVPTFGGANAHCFPELLGVKDQTEIERRKDVLVYTSDVLEYGLEIIGPLKVILYASTEGKDTDFTAKLVELRKDGYARIIEEGIIRASTRDSWEEPSLLTPGKIYELVINLNATAIFIGKGNRLRLEISSSNFPKYDRNPNTGEDAFEAEELRKVVQTVHFSRKHPSHVLLPVRKTNFKERGQSMFQIEPILFLQSLASDAFTAFMTLISQMGYTPFYVAILIL